MNIVSLLTTDSRHFNISIIFITQTIDYRVVGDIRNSFNYYIFSGNINGFDIPKLNKYFPQLTYETYEYLNKNLEYLLITDASKSYIIKNIEKKIKSKFFDEL